MLIAASLACNFKVLLCVGVVWLEFDSLGKVIDSVSVVFVVDGDDTELHVCGCFVVFDAFYGKTESVFVANGECIKVCLFCTVKVLSLSVIC